MSRGGTGPERRKRERAELEHAARKLYDLAGGDPLRLATVAAQFQHAARERSADEPLEVLGGVSAHTGRPYVRLDWGVQVGQLEVEAARAHALLVLEAAQNAVADAAILEWARDELELDVERGAVMLDALRRYRADRWGQPDLELEFGRPPADEAS